MVIDGHYSNTSVATRATKIPRMTIENRLKGSNDQRSSHRNQQALTQNEEATLVHRIKRLTRSGFPISPQLARQMAGSIRSQRLQLKAGPLVYHAPISSSWVHRFKGRNPEIGGVWSRQIDAKRHSACNLASLTRWFDALEDTLIKGYEPRDIYNMDESGFNMGESQVNRVLINVRDHLNWKIHNGRQQWVTAVECISAAGTSIPPMIIYKAEYLHSGWVPAELHLPGWYWTATHKGWTNNTLGGEWISKVFGPATDQGRPRLLILDGHASHLTAEVIEYCIEHTIELLVLPPHTSHILQPLDVAVFAPLKTALAQEMDEIARASGGYNISKQDWIRCYVAAREKAICTPNIKSGFRAAGIWPNNRDRVLSTLDRHAAILPVEQVTPMTNSFDASLLNSSPPEATDLHAANSAARAAVRNSNMKAPAKRYMARLMNLAEQQVAAAVVYKAEIQAKDDLIERRKAYQRGKRVELAGTFVYSTADVLAITRAAEAKTKVAKVHKSTAKRAKKPAKTAENTAEAGTLPAEPCFIEWQLDPAA